MLRKLNLTAGKQGPVVPALAWLTGIKYLAIKASNHTVT